MSINNTSVITVFVAIITVLSMAVTPAIATPSLAAETAGSTESLETVDTLQLDTGSNVTVYTATNNVSDTAASHGVDIGDGSISWTYDSFSHSAVGISVNMNETAVYVASRDNGVRSLNTSDGAVNWNASLGEDMWSVAVSKDDSVVYAGGESGTLYALDTTDGSEFWNISADSNTLVHISVGPNGAIYTAGVSGVVKAFDSSGTELWTYSGHANSVRTVTVSPDGSTVYSGSDDDTVRAINATTGNKQWIDNGHSADVRMVSIDPQGNLYTADTSGVYRSLAPDASERWQTTLSHGVFADGMNEYVNGRLYVGDTDGNIHQLSPSDGSVQATYNNINGDAVRVARPAFFGDTTTVNGTVVDENGDPCENCTVEAVGINFEPLSGSISQKRQKADAFRAEAKHPYPKNWTDGEFDLTLRGSDDALIDNFDTEYAAVHTAGDWDLQGYQVSDDANTWTVDAVDLTDPKANPTAGEKLLVSIWRPSDEAFYEDSADGDLPGQSTSGTIVVTQLNPSGDERTQWTVDTIGKVEIAHISNVGTKVHEAAALQLSPGYYRIHPKGHSETRYVIAVGDPESISTPYAEQLKNSADQLDAQADKLQEWINDGKASIYTTTTNETGHYSLQIPTTANEADFVAYKTPGLDDLTASYEDKIDYYEDNLTELEGQNFCSIENGRLRGDLVISAVVTR